MRTTSNYFGNKRVENKLDGQKEQKEKQTVKPWAKHKITKPNTKPLKLEGIGADLILLGTPPPSKVVCHRKLIPRKKQGASPVALISF